MKRLSCSLFIVFAILAQSPVPGQGGPSADSERPPQLVLFKTPCLAEKVLEWAAGSPDLTPRRLMDTERAARYRQFLESSQERVIASIRDGLRQPRSRTGELALEVLYRQTDLINLMLVRADAATEEALRAHPEVLGVYPNAVRYPLMDAAPGLVSAPAFWQKLGGVEQAGRGIRIGIIDSGINVDHPMLQDESLSAPAGFPQPEQFAQFTNSKVIVARNYVLSAFQLNAEPDNPRDLAGHGSRVAAAAGGNTAMGPVGVIRGIAPKAFLGNYRVFGDPAINPTTTSSAIIAAVRDGVADGMDVLNLSLGGPAADPLSDPEQITIANAVSLGVVVVVAAGNNGGRGPGSITSPGTSPDVITVGATTHNRRLLNALRLESETGSVPPQLQTIEFLPGNGTPLSRPLGPLPLMSIIDQDASQEACSPLAVGSLTGSVALVSRGTCLFAIKAANVLGTANASAMVLYNNVEGPPVRADFGQNPPTRPAGMITLQEGEQLLQLLSQGEQLQVTLQPLLAVARVPDIVAGFSGRGPNIDGSIKPDLVAPGVEILSAGPEGSSYIIASNGTSFATPQVAGAAALVLQANPDWTPSQVKSVLVNSATLATIDGQNAASVNQVGAGRLDLAAAAATVVAVTPSSLSFGALSLADGTLPPTDLSLANLSGETLEVQLAAVSNQPALRLLVPDMIPLPPGETVHVSVRPALSGTPAPGAFEGALRVLIPERPSLTVPFWGTLISDNDTDVLQVSQFPGAQFSTISEALSRARPGDVIEIQDSETYIAPLQIPVNRQGQFLHGLTLRAAPGHNPVLQASPGAEAVIEINSLENITIQGLHLQGGLFGVLARDSTGVVRDCVFEIESREAIELNGSLFHLYGNTLLPGNGSGIGLFNSSALIQKNRLGDTTGGPSEVGVFSSPEGTIALFDNQVLQTLGSENGQGLRITGPALIKNNLVSNSRGPLGDGILVRGEAASVHLQDNLVVNSQRSGISLFDGARATLLRNRSMSNLAAGLLIQDSTAAVSSCSFLENRTGIQANFVLDLSLDSSLVAGNNGGHGLEAVSDPESLISISNCTFADNSDFGVQWDRGVLDVSNSVFWANGSGDFSRPPTSARFSLLDAAGLIGQSGNYFADPEFSDPTASDYSLRAGSPAIDSGPPEDFLGHPGDLFSHQRTVDGDGDGKATIDTGAIEFQSSIAPLIMPVLRQSSNEFQGLAMANVFDPPQLPAPGAAALRPGRARLRFYDPVGNLLGETEPQVAAGRQFSALLAELFPTVSGNGWVEITPADPDLLSFTLTGANNLRYLDGSQLDSARHRTLVLPEIWEQSDEFTRLYIINPQAESQMIRIHRIRDDSGAEVVQRQLNAKSMLTARVRDLFPEAGSGFLKIEADQPISAVQLFGGSQTRAGLSGIPPSEGVTELIGAQLASTSQIDTHLNLVNLGGDQAVVSMMALDDAGGVVDQVTRVLSPDERLAGSIREFFALPENDFVGWLAVRSLSSDLAGNLRFQGPEERFLAALPLQTGGAREFLLSHVAQTSQIFTGLTLVNFGSQAAAATIEVFSRSGALQDVAFLTLAPGQKLARLLSQFVPAVTQQSGGYIRVRSTHPLAGFELFGDQDLNYLSAVPQQIVVK